MLKRLLFAVAALTPQAAGAANVYMPVVCSISSTEELECALNHVDATQTAPGEWDVQVTAGDTVYFQVSDFTHGSDYYSVEAQTHYSTTSFTNWTKSGSTATSPGETTVIRIEMEVEATTPGSKSKVRRAIHGIKVLPPGG